MWVCFWTGLIASVFLGVAHEAWIGFLTCGLLIVFILLFSSLTVSVTDDYIEVAFGTGLIRKKINVDDVIECAQVRNRWWYGFGIKAIRKGWLFNVSGLDAVELTMRNGKVYRIGTDQPQILHEFIRDKLSQRMRFASNGKDPST